MNWNRALDGLRIGMYRHIFWDSCGYWTLTPAQLCTVTRVHAHMVASIEYLVRVENERMGQS